MRSRPLCLEASRSYPSLGPMLSTTPLYYFGLRLLNLPFWCTSRECFQSNVDNRGLPCSRRYQYYLCSRCHLPYYGGERRCRPAGEEQAESQYRADELVCGSCSAGSKGVCSRGHGRDFIEYKCRQALSLEYPIFCCQSSAADKVLLDLHTCFTKKGVREPLDAL